MTELTIEARVTALENALTASEQWNVCACGHHGSAHDPGNRCMTCECPHFATRRPANVRNELTPEIRAAIGRLTEAVAYRLTYLGIVVDDEMDYEAADAALYLQDTALKQVTDADLALLRAVNEPTP